jgi:hypothetical protein
MNYIKKAVTTLGGIFLAALLTAALAPKATHGLVAALVQVTNTSANPIPAVLPTHLGTSASDLITIECFAPGTALCKPASFFTVNPDGTEGPTFVIPSGQALVITDVQWAVAGGTAGDTASLELGTQLGAAVIGTGRDQILVAPFFYAGAAAPDSTGYAARTDQILGGVMTTVVPTAEAGNGTSGVVGLVIIHGYLTSAA